MTLFKYIYILLSYGIQDLPWNLFPNINPLDQNYDSKVFKKIDATASVALHTVVYCYCAHIIWKDLFIRSWLM